MTTHDGNIELCLVVNRGRCTVDCIDHIFKAIFNGIHDDVLLVGSVGS
jgi:hypothetical protein